MSARIDSPYGVSSLALLLSLFAAGPVQADCEWSDRIEKDSAECLSGGFENHTWPDKDTAWVKNECPELGTVVAKVDRKDAPDWTKWLEGSGQVNMSGSQGNIRSIHCCSDLSDLCNKSDIINAANCIAAFEQSPAAAHPDANRLRLKGCSDPRATADPDAESCSLDVECGYWVEVAGTPRRPSPSRQFVTERRQITVPYNDVSKLVLGDDGQLSVQ